MRAILDILYYAPPTNPNTTILSAINKCIMKGGIVEHHTICRELCCRIINQILTIWPNHLWNKLSYSNENDIFINILLLLLCDKDELIRRLARVNYRLFLARVNNPLLVRNFRNNDPSFAIHMGKVFDENECNKDVAAITRLNQMYSSTSSNNNTDTLSPFLLEFEATAEVVSQENAGNENEEIVSNNHEEIIQQENYEQISMNNNPSNEVLKSNKKGLLTTSSSITSNNSIDNIPSGITKSTISNPTTNFENNPYNQELSLPLGTILYSLATHTKTTLQSTMNSIHTLLPTLATIDKRANIARMKLITDPKQNPLTMATQVLHESTSQTSIANQLPCIENTNIQELQQLALQTNELIKVLSSSLPQLQNHLDIIQERIRQGE